LIYNKAMKTLLTTLNSKFIHSNLAIRLIRAYCIEDFPGIELAEYTINDRYEKVISDIARKRPDLIGFSCYIWNIRETLDIAATIKKILPEAKIILGGPEVSYDSVETMTKHPCIDYIAVGEGEQILYDLLRCMKSSGDLRNVAGLTWRSGEGIHFNGHPHDLPLDSIPFPYYEGLGDLKDKIIYYETSRGCPYRCQFCLSSNSKRVRFLSLDRIKRDLKFFIDAGVPQVKLIDRTFNCDPGRAKEIFSYLISLGGNTNFHFEIAGDIIDDETISILKNAPAGLFQFEAGIQSTNPHTLKAVQRMTALGKLEKNISEIIKNDNIHVHLDLIAGLPEDDLSSMARSVNAVMRLRPHRLQLGFLKLLKGSGLRSNARQYEYKYTDYPPYEVLSSRSISYDDLARLKLIEEMIEVYYNSHRFDKVMAQLFKIYNDDAFRLFGDLSRFWLDRGYFSRSHSNHDLYVIMREFIESSQMASANILLDCILFDYCRHAKPGRYPAGLEPKADQRTKERIRQFLSDDDNLKKYIKGYEGQFPKQHMRKIHIEVFRYPVERDDVLGCGRADTAIMFCYDQRVGVLRKAAFYKLDL